MSDLTLVEIRDWLVTDHLEQIVEDMVPDGRISGGEWVGHLNGKVGIALRGSKRGIVGYWQNQSPGGKAGGDVISLIQLAEGLATYGQAVRYAKREYLDIEDRPFTEEEKREFARRKQEQEAERRERQARDAQKAAEKGEDVRAIWAASSPIVGTLAEQYLVGRGIPMQKWPPALRFNPGLTHPEGGRWPVLVCGVQSAKNGLIGIWRIFLCPETAGKAPVENAKLGLGPCGGGAVRLGPVSDTICVTEGVETGFGVKALLGDRWPVWAALSTSGMIGLELPAKVRNVKIYSDGDRHKFKKDGSGISDPPGPVAAEKLQTRLIENGIQVSVHIPPDGMDWLDVFNEQRGAE